MPYWFKAGQYLMQPELLQSRLRRSKLVLGDVGKTQKEFFEKFSPAPVGAILNDLDLWSSIADSLRIFETDPESFLPRVFLYSPIGSGRFRRPYQSQALRWLTTRLRSCPGTSMPCSTRRGR